MRVRSTLVLLVLGLALGVPAPVRAQGGGSEVEEADSPTERERIAAELKIVRDRRLTAGEKVDAMEELLELGSEGPRRLAIELARQLSRLRKATEKDTARLTSSFERLAPQVVQKRLDKKTLLEVEELRQAVLSNARGGSLTKDSIKKVSDPAMARLAEILVVDPNQVWDADHDLFDDFVVILDRLDEEALLWEHWDRARDALRELDPKEADRLDPQFDPRAADEALLDELARLASLATPMSERDRKVFERNETLAAEIKPEELLGCLKLNHIRVRLGMNALAIDVRLCNASRDHSKDMKEHGFFSHTSPVPGKESFGKRAALAGTSARAENIAVGMGTGSRAIDAWWYSPGHHKNMLGGHHRQSLGQHDRHWTQMFGG